MNEHSNFLHSLEECETFFLSHPPRFSHKRYLEIKARKILYRRSTNRPYLSSEVFAKLTDMKIFNQKDFQRKLRKKRPDISSLFISSDLLESLYRSQESLPNLRILVSGHSDRNFYEKIDIPDSVRVWFSQNNAITGDLRIRTLPIGIENLSLGRSGQRKYFRTVNETRIQDRVLVPPFSPTNRIRKMTVIECRKLSDCFDVYSQMIYEKEYFSLIKRYKFVLCLEGNGFDTHRIWETLYLGGFPVVLKSAWSTKLAELNLPILFINSVHEVDSALLSEFHREHLDFDPRKCQVLWEPFWKQSFKTFLQ